MSLAIFPLGVGVGILFWLLGKQKHSPVDVPPVGDVIIHTDELTVTPAELTEADVMEGYYSNRYRQAMVALHVDLDAMTPTQAPTAAELALAKDVLAELRKAGKDNDADFLETLIGDAQALRVSGVRVGGSRRGPNVNRLAEWALWRAEPAARRAGRHYRQALIGHATPLLSARAGLSPHVAAHALEWADHRRQAQIGARRHRAKVVELLTHHKSPAFKTALTELAAGLELVADGVMHKKRLFIVARDHTALKHRLDKAQALRVVLAAAAALKHAKNPKIGALAAALTQTRPAPHSRPRQSSAHRR